MVQLPQLPQGHLGDLVEAVVGEDEVLEAARQRGQAVGHKRHHLCNTQDNLNPAKSKTLGSMLGLYINILSYQPS